MACVNPDGSLSQSAKDLLAFLSAPYTPEEIASKLGRPLFKVRVSLRELSEAEFVEKTGEKFISSAKGKEKIK